jgi:hypothetical protein
MSKHAKDNVFDLSLDLLDRVVTTLAKIGIELPVLVVQIFFVALLLTLLYPLLRTLLKREKLPLTAPTVVALLLVVLGILYGIVDQALLPKYVSGRVATQNPTEVRVQLLDHQGRVISSGEGFVDSDTGAFALYYQPWLNGRAHALLLKGCSDADKRIELPRAYVRVGGNSHQVYPCGR